MLHVISTRELLLILVALLGRKSAVSRLSRGPRPLNGSLWITPLHLSGLPTLANRSCYGYPSRVDGFLHQRVLTPLMMDSTAENCWQKDPCWSLWTHVSTTIECLLASYVNSDSFQENCNALRYIWSVEKDPFSRGDMFTHVDMIRFHMKSHVWLEYHLLPQMSTNGLRSEHNLIKMAWIDLQNKYIINNR